MIVGDLHPWEVTPAEARAIQERLRSQVDVTSAIDLGVIRVVAGADSTYLRDGGVTTAYGVVVAFSFPDLETIEQQVARVEVAFPYVPGLLSFREAPALIAAFRQLAVEPDVVLFDGQGYAHPRRFGLASHLGLVLDRPAIGCAKSRLVGRADEPGEAFGDTAPLVDGGEIIGAVVRSRPGHAPLYVSPGHRIDVDSAVAVSLACCRGAFMPEPTRIADAITKQQAAAHRAARTTA